MTPEDNCCSIIPCFKVAQGNLDDFRQSSKAFAESAADEPAVLKVSAARMPPAFCELEYGFRG